MLAFILKSLIRLLNLIKKVVSKIGFDVIGGCIIFHITLTKNKGK